VDIQGAMFSLPAPSGPPVTITPHLMVLIRSRRQDPPNGGAGGRVPGRGGRTGGRNVSPFNVEPGKFTYRLVRGELEFSQLGTMEAHCRLVPDGQTTIVPLTLLPPVGA